ncbi:MAG: AAA family ATPase, partial [Acidobacteria bacterium]|nr:AAA family ATPase [Acidobacteriota bacterium]
MPELPLLAPSDLGSETKEIPARALLQYFRACLADGDLIQPNLRALEVFEISREELLAGTLPPELAKRAFEIAEEDRRSRLPPAKRKKLAPLTAAPLLVAPLVLRRRAFHGFLSEQKEALIFPLWISATVGRDDQLEADPLHLPWVPRSYLEPVTGDGWTLGLLTAFDTFLSREEPDPDGSWQEVLAYAEDLFRAVSGEAMAEYRHEDFEVLGPRFAVQQIEKGFRKPLIDLVESVLHLEVTPKIVKALASRGRAEAAPPTDELADAGGRRHRGQMTDRFPLSPSQRQSLAAALRLEEGEILAVNGPPGTGKTTLVQSIVASLWVERALEGSEPPLIHVCSTNNQAVTNVLDSFDAAASEAQGLAERWLPELSSYGLYFPSASQSRREPEKKYQTAELAGHTLRGSLGEMETARYVGEAHPFYLERAGEALGLSPGGLTVTKVVDELRRQLRADALELEERLEAAARVAAREEEGTWDLETLGRRLASLEDQRRDRGRLRKELLAALKSLPWYLELFSFLPPLRHRRDRWLAWPLIERELPLPELGSSGFEAKLLDHARSLEAPQAEEIELLGWIREELARLPEDSPLRETLEGTASPARAVPLLLDVGLRHRLFHLAGRYWEGRWLQEMEELLSDVEAPSLPPPEARLLRFRRLAKLTPVLVSTLFRSPRVFDYYDAEEGRGYPLLQGLDLLIVDEAGQVAPDVGAAVLPLARRAVVIGDEHQIEPIWGIHRRVDSANLRAVGLDPESRELEAMRASSSSLLRLAQRSTRFTAAPRRDGLLLKEHRRCVPEIIAYCNTLVYGGQLEPHREALASRSLPAMGWAHVKGEARPYRGSWVNPGEAWAIARWLRQHREELETLYGRPLDELAGVVTPFAAQRTELLKALTPEKPPRKKGRKGRSSDRQEGKEVEPEEDPLPIAEVGTVHTFQGAEREIMIFSPVYSAETAPKKRFFDDGKN